MLANGKARLVEFPIADGHRGQQWVDSDHTACVFAARSSAALASKNLEPVASDLIRWLTDD